ncbi:hypothetical protein IE53DRAFT_373099 [Violaceomyces palustris]|uniref:Uncharacterized protein n=1 Tax=Violaceomyces palustris TaxID=1673888 RepID=A0ACD0P5N7_9BASI|nr:hypothetical protein IE53DRAFT_373099 [Violaceomyces palustris]
MVGKLNYSKWDNLELSDDSDIEVHPNIDKRSFIKWKQRDIHEKREERRRLFDSLEAEKKNNQQLLPMLESIAHGTKSEGSPFYSKEVSRLSVARSERGNKDGPDGPTVEDMVLSLLLQIHQDPSVKAQTGKDEALQSLLVEKLDGHVSKLRMRQTEVCDQIEKMKAEDSRKITSDSLREGWSSGYVAKPEPAEATKAKKSTKTKVQQIETLNQPSGSKLQDQNAVDSDAEDGEDEVPELNTAMRSFADLPTTLPSTPSGSTSLPSSFVPSKHLNTDAFEVAFKFLASHKELLREESGATDALLVEAFNAEMRGEKAFARRCTEKALMIQYCNKLGKDGVSLFFKRMTQGDGRASIVFLNDVLSTYARISERSAILSQEKSDKPEGEEQIQLVAEDPNTTITFEIPDGPAPENIELEGEGSENMDVEKVKDFLNRRWAIFNSFDEDLKQALATKELDKVNQVLGKMNVEAAEEVVGKLDEAGILNFSSSEIRDETGK